MDTLLKVLFIEDNPSDTRLVKELLDEYKSGQFELIYAGSLSEGLDKLSEQAIDVVLLDLDLPDSQGINTFRKINKACPYLPIIVLTVLQDEALAVSMIDEGAQDCFVKGSFNGAILGRSIIYALERKHNDNTITKHAEIIENTSEQLSAIQLRVAIVLSEATTLNEAAHSILKAICEILEFHSGEIWVLDQEKDALYYLLNWNKHGVSGKSSQLTDKPVLSRGENIPGSIWVNPQVYWTRNLGEEAAASQRDLLQKTGLNCCLGFPIFYENELLGVFLFLGSNIKQPDTHFKLMFEIIGKQFATFIKRKHFEKDLVYLAHHDVLTGLLNKFSAESFLKQALENAKKTKTMVAFFYIDLDRFKSINDTLGHKKGDILLREMAHRLEKIVRKTDIVARFGGDEFAIVLTDIKELEAINIVAQKTLDLFKLPFVFDGKEFYLTISMGISVYPADSDDVENLIKFADLAMYSAKERGRNNYQFSSRELEKAEEKKLILETGLHKALEKNEFSLNYQPIVDVKTNNIIGFEALLRWKNSNGEMISPSEFIPLLERSSLIVSIGRWALYTACSQIYSLQKAGIQDISVNVSVHQLNHEFIKTIKTVLEETGLKPENLILEVTESMIMRRTDIMEDIINSIGQMGVRIAIDDFGTGYSSFSYLKNFRVNHLKIDQSFISEIGKNKNTAAIIEAIIVMAHALGMSAIAEGVETKEQLDFLKEKGSDAYQGYYYSKPLPFDELIKRYAPIKK